MKRVHRCTTLLAGLLVFGAGRGASQGPASLASDTLASLRAAVHAHPDSVELLMSLGRALMERADQVESHFADRMEARGYLDRAVRLRSNDARTWLEYGLLVRKQHYGVDALRALEHAERLAGHADSGFSAEDRADLHEAMGRLYEMYAQDTPFGARSNDNLIEMRKHFALALLAAPDRIGVAGELLASLASLKQWSAYVEIAGALVRARQSDAEAWLFLGMGYHEAGQVARADSAYQRALALAGPDLHATLVDISPLLRSRDSASFAALTPGDRAVVSHEYWATRDPLFLTSENERMAEHFSRVAYADLAFSDPWAGTVGRQSDKGRVWIWYGPPDHYRPNVWSYRGMKMSLVFTHMPMYRYARLTERSEFELNQVRLEAPEWYHPTHPRMVASIPFQAARFHGANGRTELDVYGKIPLDSLGRTDSIQTGFFAFALNPWKAAVEGRSTVTVAAAARPAHYVAALDAGRYLVSVEAAGNDRATVSRDTVVIPPHGTELELSDLLLADRLTPRVGTPRTRDELTIEGSPTLVFRKGSPVSVVWELYGLATDSTNTARYHVQVELRDARSGLLQALRTLTFQRNGTETSLSWDADRPLGATGMALEFATIALVDAHAGPYRLMITVTDRLNGARTSAERQFTITP